MSVPRVPRLFDALLRVALPNDGSADAIRGDLHAEFRTRAAEHGRSEATRWFQRVSLHLAVRFVWYRFRRDQGTHVDVKGGTTVRDVLFQDLRFAFRSLRRNPLFAAAAIASLTVGIGANTAIFSVVNSVLLRPLPYESPEDLTIVWNEFPGAGLARLPLSGPELLALQEQPGLFDDAAGIWGTTRTVFTPDETITVPAGVITPNFFDVLGIDAGLGRIRFDVEEGGPPVPRGVVISDELWRNWFGADPDIIGRMIRYDAGEKEVIGVLPPGFALYFPPDAGIPERIDLYNPLPWDLTFLPPAQHYLRIVGRLQPGVTMPVAQQQVTAVANRARELYPELATTGDEFTIVPLHGDSVRAARPVLVALLGAVGLFLLLSAANVASLVLARSTGRGRELAVRVSLGASRRRLAQILLTETIIVTVIGGIAGILLGRQMSGVLWALRPEGIARIDAITLDAAVVGFSLAVTLAAGIISAAAPLIQLSSLQPVAGLKVGNAFGGHGGRKMRELATVVEVAVGLVLFVGTALMSQTFANLQREDLGFDPDPLLTFRVALSLDRYPDDALRSQLAQDVEHALEAVPGISEAGASSHLPLAQWANWGDAAPPEGTPDSERDAFFVDHRSITPGYLSSIGARVVAGRDFTESDDLSNAPVVIIDQTFAERLFGDADPIGKRIQPSRYVGAHFESVWAVVVGVIDDIRDRSPREPSAGQVFWPFAQSPRWELSYTLQAEGDPTGFAEAARQAVASVQPDLAPYDMRPMAAHVRDANAAAQFVVRLARVFSGLALALAAFGLYGVITYNTTRRVRELALRIALGATSQTIVRDVVHDGVRLGALGIGGGVLAAFGITRLMQGMLYGVSATDTGAFAAGAAALFLVSVVASVLPAVRATRADPAVAMRPE